MKLVNHDEATDTCRIDKQKNIQGIAQVIRGLYQEITGNPRFGLADIRDLENPRLADKEFEYAVVENLDEYALLIRGTTRFDSEFTLINEGDPKYFNKLITRLKEGVIDKDYTLSWYYI